MLMYVVLTGGVPPFAQSLAHGGCQGMCADGLQRTISAVLLRGLDGSHHLSPLPRAAQVQAHNASQLPFDHLFSAT